LAAARFAAFGSAPAGSPPAAVFDTLAKSRVSRPRRRMRPSALRAAILILKEVHAPLMEDAKLT